MMPMKNVPMLTCGELKSDNNYGSVVYLPSDIISLNYFAAFFPPTDLVVNSINRCH